MPHPNHQIKEEKVFPSWIFGACLISLLCFTWLKYREDRAFLMQIQQAQELMLQFQKSPETYGFSHRRNFPEYYQSQTSKLLYASLPNILAFKDYNQQYIRSQEQLQSYYRHLMKFEDLRQEAKAQLQALYELVFPLMKPDTAFYRKDILPMYRVWADLLEMAENRGKTLNKSDREHLQNLMSKNQSYSLFLVERNLHDPMSPVFGLPQIPQIESKWRNYNNTVFEIFQTDNRIANSRETLNKIHSKLDARLLEGINARFTSHKKASNMFLLASVLIISLMLGVLWVFLRTQLKLATGNWWKHLLPNLTSNTGKLDQKIHDLDNWGENLSQLRLKSDQLRQLTQELADSQNPTHKQAVEQLLGKILSLEEEISKQLNSALDDYQEQAQDLGKLVGSLKQELKYFQHNLGNELGAEKEISLQDKTPKD